VQTQALQGMAAAMQIPSEQASAPRAVKVAALDNSGMEALADQPGAPNSIDAPVWLRIVGSQQRNRAMGQGTNGAHWAQFDANTQLLQGGRKVYQDGNAFAGRAVSVIGALGSVDGDVLYTNAANQRSTAGTNKVEIAALGAAFSQQFDAKTYLDAVAMVSHLRASLASVRGLGFKTSGTGWSTSFEGGRRYDLAPGWTIQPHALLQLQNLNLGNAQDAAGKINFGNARSTQAGIGAYVSTNGETATKIWTALQLLNEFEGRPATTLADANGNNGQAFFSSMRGALVRFKAGVDHRLGPASSVYVTLDHTQGLSGGQNDISATGVSVGARLSW
jgi:hypothetical protein